MTDKTRRYLAVHPAMAPLLSIERLEARLRGRRERETRRHVTHEQVTVAMEEFRARGGVIVQLRVEVGSTMANLVLPHPECGKHSHD